MRAGNLRYRVQLQSKTLTRNAYGEAVETWTTQATVWARVRALRGREAVVAGQETATATHEVGIRARSDVSPQWRVVWGAKTYNVTAVIPAEKPGGEMVLMCDEVV